MLSDGASFRDGLLGRCDTTITIVNMVNSMKLFYKSNYVYVHLNAGKHYVRIVRAVNVLLLSNLHTCMYGHGLREIILQLIVSEIMDKKIIGYKSSTFRKKRCT